MWDMFFHFLYSGVDECELVQRSVSHSGVFWWLSKLWVWDGDSLEGESWVGKHALKKKKQGTAENLQLLLDTVTEMSKMTTRFDPSKLSFNVSEVKFMVFLEIRNQRLDRWHPNRKCSENEIPEGEISWKAHLSLTSKVFVEVLKSYGVKLWNTLTWPPLHSRKNRAAPLTLLWWGWGGVNITCNILYPHLNASSHSVLVKMCLLLIFMYYNADGLRAVVRN